MFKTNLILCIVLFFKYDSIQSCPALLEFSSCGPQLQSMWYKSFCTELALAKFVNERRFGSFLTLAVETALTELLITTPSGRAAVSCRDLRNYKNFLCEIVYLVSKNTFSDRQMQSRNTQVKDLFIVNWFLCIF